VADDTASDNTAFNYSHSGICVRDLERSLRFWCDGLGFEKAETFEVGADFGHALEVEGEVAVTSQFIRKGPIAIELLHYQSPEPFGSPSARRNQLGLTHLSFVVDDVEAAAAHLVSCGGTVLESTWFGRGDPATIQILFLHDPDGVRVELMRYPA
jgi:catechol 2,3-dioxygenase-like lactoylglutathione lyase family enzyme